MHESAPTDLRILAGHNDILVAGPRPELSWTQPDGFAGQRQVQMEAVVDGISLEAKTLRTDSNVLIAWPWEPLASRQRVSWRVRIADQGGFSAWSTWADFEVGLLDADWTARWISPAEAEGGEPGRRPAYVLAASMTARRPIRRARAYASALGVYELFVNGDRCGDIELAPGASSYQATVYAQAYDVTDAIAPGVNEVEIVLSDGWYRGLHGAFRSPAAWGTTSAARLELHVEYADGTRDVLTTDERWTSRTGQILSADLMNGQVTDFTAPDGARLPVLVDQVEAPAVSWSPSPPVRRTMELRPQSVHVLDDGAYIIDFGQNASGWVRLRDLGPRGTRTVLEHGEHLDATGDLTTEHLDSPVAGGDPIRFFQRDEVVASGADDEVFEPRHTVHGFRYVRIEREGVPLDATQVSMQVVHSDFRKTGDFSCSDDDLNRLHSAAEWSFRGNAVDVPTDCPTRERSGWTGDYQVFAPTAARIFDVDGFTRKWLQAVVDDQLADGRIANFSPDATRLQANPDPTLDGVTGSSGWGDAITAVPWEMYRTYGDRHVLAETWDAMERWVAFQLETARDKRHPARAERFPEPRPHEQYIWDGSFHWGEWCEPKVRREDGTFIDLFDDPIAWFTADKGEVGTAYLYRSVATIAAVARVLGKNDSAREYERIAQLVLDAWRTEFLSADGRVASDSQAGYVRALAFELVPDELRGASGARLAELVEAADNHLTTGFLSTADLLPTLADTGRPDLAYAVLRQRTYPSWLTMLDRGATTIWEEWEGVDADGTASASLNHYSKGAVVRFLHTHVLGLRQDPESTAWKNFTVAPVVDRELTWARGGFESPQGPIAVAWRVSDGDLLLDLEVPEGSSATIVLPDGRRVTAGPGAHHERCPVRG